MVDVLGLSNVLVVAYDDGDRVTFVAATTI
jgi:hypothetical protein